MAWPIPLSASAMPDTRAQRATARPGCEGTDQTLQAGRASEGCSLRWRASGFDATAPSMSWRAGDVTPLAGPTRRFRHRTSSLRLAQVLVRKCEKHLPVLARHGMLARTNPVAEPAVHQLAHRWHLPGVQPADAQQPVHGIGCLQHL